MTTLRGVFQGDKMTLHKGEEALKNKGELCPHLLLLVRREDIDDPVDRLHAGVRVQCGKGEMACFSGQKGRLNRLQIPHLTDEDDIRILAKEVPWGPVTNTRPLGFLINSLTMGGIPSSEKLRMSKEMARKAPATAPLCI